jgi:hypothetical protein
VPGRPRSADAAWGVLALSAVIGFGAYLVARAESLSFTHDESLSYLNYVKRPISSVLLSRETDANNHPLNTAAMKLGELLFGPSELALRWSAVLAFVVYAVALFVILRRVERLSIRVLGLVLGLANPYVLDFFSLARGYGLALAAVAVSVMFTLGYVERPRPLAATAATVFGAIAVLANFATLTYFLAALFVILLRTLLPAATGGRPVSLGRLGAALALPTIGVVFLAVLPLARLRSEDELYFGGDRGFWEDTVQSVIASSLYRRSDLLSVVLVVLVAVIVAGGAVAAAVGMRTRNLPLHAAAFILLAGPALVSTVEHHILGVPFLIDRTALFFVPLFAIWLALAADALARDIRFTAAVRWSTVLIGAAACVNLATAANTSYALDWRYDADTEEVMTELAGPPGERRPTDFGVSYLFQPTTSFYRETRFRWLPECLAECLDARSDYYYVIGQDVQTVQGRGARIVRVYGVSGGVLARDAGKQG